MSEPVRGVVVVWRRGAAVLWRRSLDAVVLLPPGIDEPVSLVGTGAVVWDLLAEPATLGDLVAALTEAYGAEPAVVAHDVGELLARLDAMGAIEASEPPGDDG